MGKSIRVYLPNGSVSGIRHGEIVNWTGQALACPRSRFQDLSKWDEVHRPGVYFLFGSDEESGEEAVYIGEAEVVLDRLSSHISAKDFWTELVAFTSKDDNLTKAHVRYLESRLVALAKEAGRYRLINAASPQLPALPRAEIDAMEEFLDLTRTLLGVLGHRVLEPLVSKSRSVIPPSVEVQPEGQAQAFVKMGVEAVAATDPTFHLHVGNLNARATRTDEGIVVLAESEAALNPQSSLPDGYRALRQKLIDTGDLIQFGTKLKLTRDHLFTSPSQAAAVLVETSINGRDAWRLFDGTTYAAYETRLTESLRQELAAKS